jgi:hypothetical protein
MNLNHIHVQDRDLPTAVDWFASILKLKPGFQNERIATFIFGAMTIIIDAASADSPATIGFESDDCDRDFEMLVGRGAVSVQSPVNNEWGVRTAYFKGPGAIKCEIEGPVAKELPRRV